MSDEQKDQPKGPVMGMVAQVGARTLVLKTTIEAVAVKLAIPVQDLPRRLRKLANLMEVNQITDELLKDIPAMTAPESPEEADGPDE